MKKFSRQHPHWALALIAILCSSFYWSIWAADRYVSKATVVLESPQLASNELSFASLLQSGGNHKDLLLLREYLLSVDMLKIVQQKLDFRAHYNSQGDIFSRLIKKDAPIEELHNYYLRRVSVELDEYAGVLNIQAQAYNPEYAQQLVSLLLEAGEEQMNEMGRRLAAEQVHFLENELTRLNKRLILTQNKLLVFQNKQGLVSPSQTIENINQVVANLEGELARMQAKRTAVSSYQSQHSGDMKHLQSEINALREQINSQRKRLAQAAGDSLNKVSAEYNTLELQAQFAQQTYSNALAALENTQLEAARQLKQVSVLQSPLLPEYATEPHRLYNISVFALITLFLAFIASMLAMIIRDHRD